MLREDRSDARSDVTDSEGIEDSGERPALAFINPLEQVLYAFFTPPLKLHELIPAGMECIEICHIGDKPSDDELIDDGFPQSFDIHCAAGGPMFDAPSYLHRAFVVFAEVIHLSLGPGQRRIALR